jgi:copper chaperone CopZ
MSAVTVQSVESVAMSCITEITALHEVPGRVRFFVPMIKTSPANAETLQEHLRKVPGIYHVKTSAPLGTLIIYFDSSVLTKESLHDHIHACRLNESPAVDHHDTAHLRVTRRMVHDRGLQEPSRAKSALLLELVKHGLLVASGSSSSGLGLGITALRTLLAVTSRAH